MTNSTNGNLTIGQIVWKFERLNRKAIPVTITKIGKLSVACSDGNTYNMHSGHYYGFLRGDKYGPQIALTEQLYP